jgi:tetratricopeptide (TPR) repeat protein
MMQKLTIAAGTRVQLWHSGLRCAGRVVGSLMLASVMTVLVAPMVGCKPSTKMNLKGETNEDLRTALRLAKEGDELRKKGNHQSAAMKYKQSIDVKSDLGAVWVNYGVSLMELGDRLPARSAFLRAADILPTDPTPYENLGTLYHLQGHDEPAMEYYELSLRKDRYWLPSLRGAIISAKNLRLANDKIKQYIDDAVMIEKDPDMLRLMQTERVRVDSKVKAEPVTKGFS